jgi:hypothetical protein
MRVLSLKKPKFLKKSRFLKKPKFLKRISEYLTNIPSGFKQAISILLVLALAVALWIFLTKQTVTTREELQIIQSKPTPAVTLKIPPAPSPRPIPHGKIGFSVGQADKTGPQFGRGDIDPYDPPQGSKQTVTISVKDEQPIIQVTAILKTDNTISQPYSFQLISGSVTDGQWQGSWTIDDTYLYTYNLVLEATSSRGQSTVEITFR